jgi:membrane-bound lytic murein transglycosylase F
MPVEESLYTLAAYAPVIQAAYSSVSMTRTATLRLFLPGLLCGLLAGCGSPQSILQQVQEHNELIVITRNSPTTYYEGSNGPTGFEYELVRLFAEYIGVELRIVVPPNFNDIFTLTALGDAHLAAAGLTITEQRKQKVRFGPVYQEITPKLVYRSGSVRPKSLADLKGTLEVIAGSSHEELLQKLQQEYPNLSWTANATDDSEQLLNMVSDQLIEYTIMDSNELSINRHFYPEVKPAFAISDPEPLAWAFPKGKDNTLLDTAITFFNKIRRNGTLDQLLERYYGHIAKFDYVGTRRYLRDIEQRLPAYRDTFKAAAEEVGMDWRLLAAIGYQESHWDPDAVSPTGVRGIMMLTRDAARDIGVEDRRDPEQSIHGGTGYLVRLLQNIPERIPEPDRTWLALAAYNVGLGHLEDARKLTQKNKGNSDRWVDVKKHLPLLSQKKWFQQTRYGYARGREPVRYVENVRTYYDILVWVTEQQAAETKPPRDPLQFGSPAL